MLRRLTIVAVLLVSIILSTSTVSAIQRVAPRLGMLEFYAGYTIPQGTYDKFLGIWFQGADDRLIKLDADDVWNNGYYVGGNYGRMVRERLLVSAGFRFTRAEASDLMLVTFGLRDNEVNHNIYEFELNGNWVFMDLRHNSWSPYVGLGLRAGWLQVDFRHFATEYSGTADLGINFGADIKLWEASDKRSFITLASANSWSFAASDDRPRTVKIGASLKYFFRQ